MLLIARVKNININYHAPLMIVVIGANVITNYNVLEVVKMDQSAMMNEKDKEFANREIKLEYRDEHGRLLTRKEAYRQMCYQFHGHGSSKKNEERRLKQIARERAEAAAASRHQGGKGTLGALQATQEATGKAFVVHKTG